MSESTWSKPSGISQKADLIWSKVKFGYQSYSVWSYDFPVCLIELSSVVCVKLSVVLVVVDVVGHLYDLSL